MLWQAGGGSGGGGSSGASAGGGGSDVAHASEFCGPRFLRPVMMQHGA